MGDPHIIEGQLHSPYFVFVRDWDVEDDNALRLLAVRGYERCEEPAPYSHYICISQQGAWTMIADDWYYSLWHSSDFLAAVREIGRQHDVFAFMVGDSDYSFEIEYHRDGRLQRQFVFDQPAFGAGAVRCDFGIPFAIESEITLGGEPLAKLWKIAEALGIPATTARAEVRVFERPYVKPPRTQATWEERIAGTEQSRQNKWIRATGQSPVPDP